MYTSYIKSKLQYAYVYLNYSLDWNCAIHIMNNLEQMPIKLYLFKHTQTLCNVNMF